jgi:MFS family permease
LQNGQFTRYLTGEAISMTGTWMQVMAQAWVMTDLTHKAVMLGLVPFAGGIPMLALTMYGGKCADRYDKRKILIATQIVQIISATSLGWLVASHQIQIWHILVCSFFCGIAAAFEMPASAALVPELVGVDKIAVATAIDRSVFHGTRFIGPAVAGILIGACGEAAAFYANAASFLALIAALCTLHPRPAASAHEEEQRRGSIKDGLRYVRSDQPTLAMIGLVVATVFFVFPVMGVMLPLYSKDILGLDVGKAGLLMGLAAIGALTGSISLLSIPRHRRRKIMMLGAIAGSAALCGLAVAHQFLFAVGSVIMLAVGISTLFGLANTVVQERAPGPMRGRVSAIFGLSFFGLMPFAALGITSVADQIGLRHAMFVSSFSYLALALYVLAGHGKQLDEVPAAVVTAAAIPADNSPA